MKRFTSVLIGASLILSPILYGQDAKKDSENDEPKLPKNVSSILEKCENDALNLRKTYEEGLLKVYQASEKKLIDAQTELTKKGDLETALMVKEKISTFKKEISDKMNEVGKENWKNIANNDEKPKKNNSKNNSKNNFPTGKWLVQDRGWQIEIIKTNNEYKISLNENPMNFCFLENNTIYGRIGIEAWIIDYNTTQKSITLNCYNFPLKNIEEFKLNMKNLTPVHKNVIATQIIQK